jgi:branched-chain amino acid transport system substrate-binding protein
VIVLALAIGVGSSGAAETWKPVGQPLTILYMGSTTGAAAPFASIVNPPLKMAQAWINETGGINHHQLIIKQIDSQGNPAQAVVNYQANKSNAIAMQVFFSGELAAVAPLAKADGMPITTESTSLSVVPPNHPPVFSMSPNLQDMSFVAMRDWVKALGRTAKNFVVFENISDPANAGQAGACADKLKRMGMNVTEIDYATGDDVSSLVLKAKAANPDAIVVGAANSGQGAAIAQEVRRQGMTQPMIIPPVVANANYLDLFGSAAEGIYEYVPLWREDPDPKVQTFMKLFHAVAPPGVQPDGVSQQIYDDFRILAIAMRDVHAENMSVTDARAAVLAELPKIRMVDGVGKKIGFGPSGFVGGNGFLLRVHNGVTQKISQW